MQYLSLLQYPFLQNALISSAFVALSSAIIGFFLLEREMAFVAHAYPNIGFAGAAGAALLGLPPFLGLIVFTVTAALLFARLGRESRERDLGIGIVMVFALGWGVFFLSLYPGSSQRAYGLLFGTVLGISSKETGIIQIGSLLVLLVIMLIYRPLLFSTFDPETAKARGIPIGFIFTIFLIAAAITVSLAVPVTGVMLVFTLLIGPAATARMLSRRPWVILIAAVLLGEADVFAGIVLAVFFDSIPASFFVAVLSFAMYATVWLISGRKRIKPVAEENN